MLNYVVDSSYEIVVNFKKKNGFICLRILFICLFIYLEFIYFVINI